MRLSETFSAIGHWLKSAFSSTEKKQRPQSTTTSISTQESVSTILDNKVVYPEHNRVLSKYQIEKQNFLNEKYRGKLSTWNEQVVLLLSFEYVSEEEIWINFLYGEQVFRKKFHFGTINLVQYLNEKQDELQNQKNETKKDESSKS